MNKIALPRDFIYEFSLDKEMVSNYLNLCLSSNLKFQKASAQETNEYAYPIPYDESLLNQLTKYVNEVGQIYFQNSILKICDIWLTKTDLLQVSRLHDHCGSIFSGLVYLHDNDVETIFTVPDYFIEKNYSMLGIVAKSNFETYLKIKPEIGKLIIWPSYIKHKVSTNKTKQSRYTLAFNAYPNGVLSSYNTQRLEISVKDPEYL